MLAITLLALGFLIGIFSCEKNIRLFASCRLLDLLFPVGIYRFGFIL